MEILPYVIAILSFAFLCAGWVAIQLLAKKLGTKNHFDNAKSCCGLCDYDDHEECPNDHACERDNEEKVANNYNSSEKGSHPENIIG